MADGEVKSTNMRPEELGADDVAIDAYGYIFGL